jgi:hypothetical protein
MVGYATKKTVQGSFFYAEKTQLRLTSNEQKNKVNGTDSERIKAVVTNCGVYRGE